MARKKDKEDEENYPLVKITKNLPKRLEDRLIPKVYIPPTDEAVVVGARRKFYTSEEVSQSFCQVLDSYKKAPVQENTENHGTEKIELPETGLENPPAKLSKQELQKILSRSALAEHRRDAGLDKLKDFIKEKIFESCSFERGIKMLYKYVKEKESPGRQDGIKSWEGLAGTLGRQDTLMPLIDVELPFMEEVLAVSDAYPDLTADEVALLSLARPLREEWIFDENAPFYYPPALITMSIDGLDFAFGTIDEKFENDIKKTTAFKIGGISGIDTQTEHIPFDHNFAQAIKALAVLETDDQDIFNRFWASEDINAIKRGDVMLIKAFLEGQKEEYGLKDVDLSQTYIQQLIEDKTLLFGKGTLDTIRSRISQYYSANTFRNSYLNNVMDFVKLIGLLKKVPKFIEEQKKFDGYVMFYGGNIEFVDMQGRIESVPVIDYALHEVSFNIHGTTIDTSRKNELIQRIYKELYPKIISKNLDEGNMMAIDVLRANIWDNYRIFLPLDIISEDKKVDRLEFLLKGFLSDEYVERTVKFGFNELNTIKKLLDLMPKEFSKYVRSIIKEEDPSFSLETFRTGEIRGGSYCPVTGRIEISLPIEVPVRFFEEKYKMEAGFAQTDEQKEHLKKMFFESELHNALFQHIVLHEIAESIYTYLSDECKKNWFELAVKPEAVAGKEDEYFLTQYSKKNPAEDFCETFATYVLYGKSFRDKTMLCPHLFKKYDFMYKLFSADGKEREYDDRPKIPMSMLHDDPKKTMAQIAVENMIRETQMAEERARTERMKYIGTAMSYEDVEEVILEHEEKGIKISKIEATQILQREEIRAAEEDDEMLHLELLCKKLTNKTMSIIYEAGAEPNAALFLPGIFKKEGEKGAIGFLYMQGASKDKAEKCLAEISKLYELFPEAYEKLAEDYGESEAPLTEIVTELSKLIKQEEGKDHTDTNETQ